MTESNPFATRPTPIEQELAIPVQAPTAAPAAAACACPHCHHPIAPGAAATARPATELVNGSVIKAGHDLLCNKCKRPLGFKMNPLDYEKLINGGVVASALCCGIAYSLKIHKPTVYAETADIGRTLDALREVGVSVVDQTGAPRT